MTERTTFGTLTIAYDERVLEPRPWTSAQSEWAAEVLVDAPPGPVLELCAGAGQIGLLAVASSERELVCVDADPTACDYARANAASAGIGHRVDVRRARLAEALAPDERFAVVVADPPWVPRDQVGRYPDDPRLAIDGGSDGLDVARACLDVISRHLAPGGSAILQLGTCTQADVLRSVLCCNTDGLTVVELRQFPRGVLVRIDRSAG